MTKEDYYKQLNKERQRLKKEQITEIYATLGERISRYVRIKLIEYILNTMYS